MLGLVRILFTAPRDFPVAFVGFAKRFVRNIWDARGGGLYACGFLITFLWLGLTMLFDDMVNFTLEGHSIVGNVIRYLIRFSTESIGNTVQAFIWPVTIILEYEIWGAVALGIGFAVFPTFLKKPLERWLFK